jgi:hypothetical protein
MNNDVKNLVNWRMLSLQLAGNQQSIRKNNIPKKYLEKVNEILKFMEKTCLGE